jgi:uncharacterized RDD family membrane protein YckC
MESRPEPSQAASPPATYGELVPPGGWHRPIPARAVPGELAGWWSRAGASVVDAALVALPALLVAGGIVALVGAAGGISFDDDGTGVLVGLLAVVLSLFGVLGTLVLTALLYAPLTMRRPGTRNGQTWGKQLFGVRVARMGGEPSTFASAAVREVGAKFLLFGVVVGALLAWIPLLVDVLWPIWDDENRALHDMLVDTRVVRA